MLEALSVVERYEEYLFQRAWARAFIVIGAVFPLSIFLILNVQSLVTIIGADAAQIVFFANILAITLCWGIVMYSFLGAWRTVRERRKDDGSDSKHGAAIGIVWFIAFMLTSLVPSPFQIYSLLWASSGACLISYMILRVVKVVHSNQKVVLFLGVMLGMLALPLLLIQDAPLLDMTSLVAFSVCFILAGIFMHRLTVRTLRYSE